MNIETEPLLSCKNPSGNTCTAIPVYGPKAVNAEHKLALLSLYASHVPAGFPSPADDCLEGTIDLNELLIKHPAATFLVRASGDSMEQAGIHDGDILVVDRSLKPGPGKIVIAALDGQLTVKRLQKNLEGELILCPENAGFDPIVIKEGNELLIWGVVACVLHWP